jgi:hypothetical protein
MLPNLLSRFKLVLDEIAAGVEVAHLIFLKGRV